MGYQSQIIYFVLQISQPPTITQKLLCIQNVRMDLSFQEKKTICKSVFGYQVINQTRWLIFFDTPCSSLDLLIICSLLNDYLFKTCSWLTQGFLMIQQSWLVNDLFMTCSWIFHDLLTSYSWLSHDLFTTCNELFMT